MGFNQGDIVKIGNGSTRYTVLGTVSEGITVVQSHNTGKSTSQATRRLTLVQSVQDAAYEAGCSVEELTGVAPAEEPVKEHTAYQKAVLFALNKFQKHVYAGTVRKNVKAKRRGLSLRQKASRKANRP